MTVLFIPLTFAFSANIIAGAGLVVQTTYTVPLLKRAVLTHTFTIGNANAGAVGVNAEIYIDVIPIAAVASNRVNSLQCSGLVTRTAQSYLAMFDLVAGDLARIITINPSAVNIVMGASFTIQEYN